MTVLHSDELFIVRPYVLTAEHRHKQRRQQQHRRTLLLATVGIDAGPRTIHGVEVPR